MLILIYMNEIINDFGLISNFIYVIYVKGIFNPTMNFKKILFI